MSHLVSSLYNFSSLQRLVFATSDDFDSNNNDNSKILTAMQRRERRQRAAENNDMVEVACRHVTNVPTRCCLLQPAEQQEEEDKFVRFVKQRPLLGLD